MSDNEADEVAEGQEETKAVKDAEPVEAKEQPDEGAGREDGDEEDVDAIMAEVEENPPEKLEDWPGGQAKYRTIGGSDDNDEAWEDGPTDKLGPTDLRYHEDGSVSIKGEKVDNPDDYKGEPIPGGPTDPDAPTDPGSVEEDEESKD